MVFFIFIQLIIEYSVSKQLRPCSVASDLGLHRLPMSHRKGARLIWVNLQITK